MRSKVSLRCFPPGSPLRGERETALYTRKRMPQADFFDTLTPAVKAGELGESEFTHIYFVDWNHLRALRAPVKRPGAGYPSRTTRDTALNFSSLTVGGQLSELAST